MATRPSDWIEPKTFILFFLSAHETGEVIVNVRDQGFWQVYRAKWMGYWEPRPRSVQQDGRPYSFTA